MNSIINRKRRLGNLSSRLLHMFLLSLISVFAVCTSHAEEQKSLDIDEMVKEVSGRSWVVNRHIDGHYYEYTIFKFTANPQAKITNIEHETVLQDGTREKPEKFKQLQVGSISTNQAVDSSGNAVPNALTISFKFGKPTHVHNAQFTFSNLLLKPVLSYEIENDKEPNEPETASAHGKGTGT